MVSSAPGRRQQPAQGDLWGSDVVVTTSRGAGNTLPIAEYAVASILHFAKGLHRAAVDRDAGAFDHRAYRPLLRAGQDRLHRRRRRHRRRGRPAVRRARHARRRHPPPAAAGRAPAGRVQRARRPRRSRPVPGRERFRGDLLPVDARDHQPVQRPALCRHEGRAPCWSTSPAARSSTSRRWPTRSPATICAASRSMSMSASSSARRWRSCGPIRAC